MPGNLIAIKPRNVWSLGKKLYGCGRNSERRNRRNFEANSENGQAGISGYSVAILGNFDAAADSEVWMLKWISKQRHLVLGFLVTILFQQQAKAIPDT